MAFEFCESVEREKERESGRPGRHSRRNGPDQLLVRHLVFMFCGLECEVLLLFQVEERFSEAGRMIVPFVDSHAETAFFTH
jgi:hypothetical protein